MSMRTFLSSLIIIVVTVITVSVMVFGLLQKALGEPMECVEELREVAEDTQAPNLINGLELEREHVEFIIQENEETRQSTAGYLEKANTRNLELDRALRTLQELKAALSVDSPLVPDSLRGEIHHTIG